MSLYICELCGVSFDTPRFEKTRMVVDGAAYVMAECVCPVCGESHYIEANLCRCGKPKPCFDKLCKSCKADLLARFTAFADELTADETAQLDDWLDGESVTARRRWR